MAARMAGAAGADTAKAAGDTRRSSAQDASSRGGKKRGALRLAKKLLVRLLALGMLAGVTAAAYDWWQAMRWRPPLSVYPVQGVEIGAGDGPVDWQSLAAIGAKFAYVDASSGTRGRDARFSQNLDAARDAGFAVGAVHRYDPCRSADEQASNFVTVVPRDRNLLPAAVDLETLADGCDRRVSEAAVESELMVFLNQIELHTGRAVILKVSPDFEAHYGVGARFDRKLWLVTQGAADGKVPDYAGRSWTLWTANPAYANAISQTGLRWLVSHPED